MLRAEVNLPARATSLVVRPRLRSSDPLDAALAAAAGATGASANEPLIFFGDRVHVLEGGRCGLPFKLGPQLRLTEGGDSDGTSGGGTGNTGGAGSNARLATTARGVGVSGGVVGCGGGIGLPHRICDSTPCAVYEPVSDSVMFVEGYGVLRMDRRNRVTLVAGCHTECDRIDGAGGAARFQFVRGMATDGRGNVYVAESDCIRRLAVAEMARGEGEEEGGGGGSPFVTGGAVGSGGSAVAGEMERWRNRSSGSSGSGSSGSASDGGSMSVRCGVGAMMRGSLTGSSGSASSSAGIRGVTDTSTACGSSTSTSSGTAAAYATATPTSAVRRGNGEEAEGHRGQSTAGRTLKHPTVTTLYGTVPPGDRWYALSYDTTTDMLLAATDTAIFHIDTSYKGVGSGNVSGSGGGSTAVRLLAGDMRQRGHVEGRGSSVRFHAIAGMMPAADGGVYVSDAGGVRQMDPRGEVRELFAEGAVPSESSYMAVLPQGCLAVCGSGYPPHTLVLLGSGFRPAPQMQWLVPLPSYLYSPSPYTSSWSPSSSSPPYKSATVTMRTTRGWLPYELLLEQQSPSLASSSPNAAAAATIVSIRVGDLALTAHRAVLSTRSEYFRHLLSTCDFAEAGACELTLPDAAPDAFAALLSYMYCGILDVPPHALRRVTELAGQLLMYDACEELQQRVLVSTSPTNVLSDLIWAERHNLSTAVAGLASYFVQHRRPVVMAEGAEGALRQLTESCPQLAAKLLLAVSVFW